jgi:hypothetical protein
MKEQAEQPNTLKTKSLLRLWKSSCSEAGDPTVSMFACRNPLLCTARLLSYLEINILAGWKLGSLPGAAAAAAVACLNLNDPGNQAVGITLPDTRTITYSANSVNNSEL